MGTHRAWRNWRAACAALLAVLAIAGCGGTRWLGGHALEGKLWDAAAGRFISEAELAARLAGASVVLLGETHDNRQHHRIQAALLRQAAQAGRAPVLAMEQFDREHQAAIDAARRDPGIDAGRLADAGRFDRKGWGWEQYAKLLATAVELRLPLAAINLSRGQARSVSRDGFAALGPGAPERMAVEGVWNEARDATMRRMIEEGHCGNVPEDILVRIVRSQRARDAVMADAIAERLPQPVVAVLGRGHARRDVGVPIYLAQRAPQTKVLVLAMLEVEPGREAPADYADVAAGAYDIAWFTRRANRADPCQGFSPSALGKGGK